MNNITENTSMMNMFNHIDNIKTIPVNIVCKNFLPLIEGGGYNLISGRGGLGKSMVALRSLIYYLLEIQGRTAMAVFTEDDRDEINKRIFTICRNEFGMTDLEIKSIKQRMLFKTVDTPQPMKLVSKGRDGVKIQQSFFELIQLMKDNQVGFIVFDPLKAFHDVDENFNSDMDTVMRDCFQRLGAETHACVVVLHHSSKSGSGARGASTIEDSSRISYNLNRFTVRNNEGEIVPDEDKNGEIKVSVRKDTKNIFHEHCQCLGENNSLIVFPTQRANVHFEHDVKITEFQSEEEPQNTPTIEMPDLLGDNETIIIHNQTETGQETTNTVQPSQCIESIQKDLTMRVSLRFSETDRGATYGWTNHYIPFCNFADMIRDKNVHYSASQWHQGHRHGDNYHGHEQFIVFDIDDGMTFDEGIQLFQEYNAVLMTTKSHQIEKSGVKCDRFRVIIPYLMDMDIDEKDMIRATKTKIYESVGADKQVANLASKFKGSPQNCRVYWTNGSKLFDWQPFYSSAMAEREHQRYLNEQRRMNGTDFSDMDDQQKIKAISTYYKNKIQTDGRNNVISATLLFGKKEQIPDESLIEILMQLNDTSVDPLPHSEMNQMFKYHCGRTA